MTKSQLYTFLTKYIARKGAHRSWVEFALQDFPNVLKALRHNIGDELQAPEVYLFLKPEAGKCKTCSKPTGFRTFVKGFKPYCSTECYHVDRYGPKEELEIAPKLVVADFDDIVDPANPPRPKEEKPAKKKVISEVEKQPVITEDPVLKTSSGTMHGKAEKPTIAVEYSQPKVRLLADLKQFGIREPRPKEKWDFKFKPIMAKDDVPRITQGHWDTLKESQDLVTQSESERLARKARREQRRKEVEDNVDIPDSPVVEQHGDRTFNLCGMEPFALSTLLYELEVPLHFFDEQNKLYVPYTRTSDGKARSYLPNLVLQNKVVIHVMSPHDMIPDKLELARDRCAGVVWGGRHFLMLVVDIYGNIFSANVDKITDLELEPLDYANMQELAKIIKGLILD